MFRRILFAGSRAIGAECERRRPDGTTERVDLHADDTFVCAGATQTPALLQRSGIRYNIGRGLKMHPTVKIAARFDSLIDHGDVPMHRVTEFAPGLTIGGSASPHLDLRRRNSCCLPSRAPSQHCPRTSTTRSASSDAVRSCCGASDGLPIGSRR